MSLFLAAGVKFIGRSDGRGNFALVCKEIILR